MLQGGKLQICIWSSIAYSRIQLLGVNHSFDV